MYALRVVHECNLLTIVNTSNTTGSSSVRATNERTNEVFTLTLFLPDCNNTVVDNMLPDSSDRSSDKRVKPLSLASAPANN